MKTTGQRSGSGNITTHQSSLSWLLQAVLPSFHRVCKRCVHTGSLKGSLNWRSLEAAEAISSPSSFPHPHQAPNHTNSTPEPLPNTPVRPGSWDAAGRGPLRGPCRVHLGARHQQPWLERERAASEDGWELGGSSAQLECLKCRVS